MDSEAGFRRRELDAVHELDAGTGVVREQEVSVEVDVIAEAGDLAGRSNRQARLDHAAEHDSQAERACGVRHPHGLADATRLRELDVDAVRAVGALRDVGQRVAVLVHVDRDGSALLQLRSIWIAGGEGLLAVLDARLGQRRQRLERLVQRPVLVDVDLERKTRGRAYSPNALYVQAVATPELQLETAEPSVARSLGVARHRIRVLEGDGPRRRRPLPQQAEEAPHREAGELAAKVVEGGVDRGASRELLQREPLEDRIQREGIVAELVRVRFEIRKGGRGGLVVPLDRRRLPHPGRAVVGDLDLDDLNLGLRPARNREWLLELEADDPSAQMY